MKKLGITGGIGSGKSMVISLLKSMRIPAYIADEEAKRLMNTSSQIKEQLIIKFGSSIYENNQLNKKKLASLIFNNEKNLKAVNAIVHPAVRKDFLSWTEKFNDHPIVAIESAILFESGFNLLTDYVWTIFTPADIRISRVMTREKISREMVLERIKNQIPEEEKCLLSDNIIQNDNIRALIPQVEKLISDLCEE